MSLVAGLAIVWWVTGHSAAEQHGNSAQAGVKLNHQSAMTEQKTQTVWGSLLSPSSSCCLKKTPTRAMQPFASCRRPTSVRPLTPSTSCLACATRALKSFSMSSSWTAEPGCCLEEPQTVATAADARAHSSLASITEGWRWWGWSAAEDSLCCYFNYHAWQTDHLKHLTFKELPLFTTPDLLALFNRDFGHDWGELCSSTSPGIRVLVRRSPVRVTPKL